MTSHFDFDVKIFDPPRMTTRPTKTKFGLDTQGLAKGVIMDDRLLWVATNNMNKLGIGTLLIRNLEKSRGAGGDILPEHEHFDIQPRGLHAGRRGQSRITVLDRVFHFPALNRVGHATAQLAMWAMLRAPRDVEVPTASLVHRTANGMGKPRNDKLVHAQKMLRSAESVRDRLGRLNTRGRLVLKHFSILSALHKRESDMCGIGVRMNARAGLLAWAEDELVRMLTERGVVARQFLDSPTIVGENFDDLRVEQAVKKLHYEASVCHQLQVQPYVKLARAMTKAFDHAAHARKSNNIADLKEQLQLVVNYARIPAIRHASSIVTFQVAQAHACRLSLHEEEWDDLFSTYSAEVVGAIDAMLSAGVNVGLVAHPHSLMTDARDALCAGDLRRAYTTLTCAEDVFDGIMINDK